MSMALSGGQINHDAIHGFDFFFLTEVNAFTVTRADASFRYICLLFSCMDGREIENKWK